MEKRVLIAFILSFAVLYGFRFIFPPPPAPEPPAVADTEQPAPAPPAVPEAEAATLDGEVLKAELPEEVKIQTGRYLATVLNVGGVLRSFQLTEEQYFDGAGNPTELIDQDAGRKVGFPLALTTADPALDRLLAEALFTVEREGNSVSLVYRAEGIEARKDFGFDEERYVVSIATSLTRNGRAVPHQVAWRGGFGDQSIVGNPATRNAIYFSGADFERIPLTGIEEPQEIAASLAGVEDMYFLAMFLREPGPVKISKADYTRAPERLDGTEGEPATAPVVAVPGTEGLKLYVGPKAEESLAAVDPRLEGAINYGWFLFAALAKPLLIALRWIYGFLGNYGWAIVVLTFAINMLLFPLRVKQQLSMQKMQKLAPHMRQLQEKYKKLKAGDPKKAEVEKELMEINKQQLGGCLPMLLQLPLLLAFYNMITAAIELRGAPWLLWITDLSKPDHLHILPILMGVAMFVQMKMSPPPADPAQAKLMMIMPVFVTILFIWFQSASGLTLYWFTGNVISIAQQWFIRNYWSEDGGGKPQRRAGRQPAPA